MLYNASPSCVITKPCWVCPYVPVCLPDRPWDPSPVGQSFGATTTPHVRACPRMSSGCATTYDNDGTGQLGHGQNFRQHRMFYASKQSLSLSLALTASYAARQPLMILLFEHPLSTLRTGTGMPVPQSSFVVVGRDGAREDYALDEPATPKR